MREATTGTEGSVCKRCKQSFTCGVAAGQKTCWCFDLPPLAKKLPPSEDEAACYCPACLKELTGR